MQRLLLLITIGVSPLVMTAQCDAGVGSLLRAAGRKSWKAVSETAEAGLRRVGLSKSAAKAAKTASRGVVHVVPGTASRQVLLKATRDVSSTGSSASGMILSRLGVQAAGAVNKLSPTATARVAEMSTDLVRSPHCAEWLRLLRTFGDEAADFLWKHKGSVAVATTATAVVLSPADFLQATGRMAETVVETTGSHVVQPVITGAVEQVAAPVVRAAVERFPWSTFCNAVMLVAVAGGMWWYRCKR